MVSYRQVAAGVRAAKERNPEKFCAHPRCLWRLDKLDEGVLYCPRHEAPERKVEA